MKYPLIFAVALSFLLPLQSRAMDCAKAVTSVEKMICADPELRQLDALLNKDYPGYAEKQGQARARSLQTDWLRQRDACAAAPCLKEAYTKRIRELSGAEKIFIFRQAAPGWDIFIAATGCGKKSYSDDCEDAATVDIFAKDSDTPFQRINMPELFVEVDKSGGTTVNTIQVYGDYNSCLVMDDYNFDGHADLALRNGNNGGYGGPSYDIRLFDPIKKSFVLNKALTELASNNLGLFSVDAKEKTLMTFTKSGCCWHQNSFYQVRKNAPVLVREITEDATQVDGDNRWVEITERKLLRGQWHETKTREKMAE